jgi:hypothetical protein
MKTLFTLFLSIFLTTFLFSQTKTTSNTKLYYCIQVVSTENPQLLKPSFFIAMYEKAMVEKAIVNNREYYRIIFIYNSIEEQDSALHNWKHQWKDSIRVTKTQEQVSKMYPLFTYD